MLLYDMPSENFRARGENSDFFTTYTLSQQFNYSSFGILTNSLEKVKNNHFTSRLLAIASKDFILDYENKETFIKETFNELNLYNKLSNNNINDTKCTLSIIKNDYNKKQKEHIKTYMFGDGYIIARKDKLLEIYKVYFDQNKSYYPLLDYNLNLKKEYLNNNFGRYYIHYWEMKDNELIKRNQKITSNIIKFDEIFCFEKTFYLKDKYKFIAIANNGIESFYKNMVRGIRRPLESEEVYSSWFKFKNVFGGKYITNMLTTRYKKLQKNRWRNKEDIGLSLIWF